MNQKQLIKKKFFYFMEYTYQYSWIIPFVPLPTPLLVGVGLLLFPTATKDLRRMWVFPSVLFLSIVMSFSTYLFFQQKITLLSIYLYGLGLSIMTFL